MVEMPARDPDGRGPLTTSGRWRDLPARLGRRVDGLIESVPMLDSGSALFSDDDRSIVAGPGVAWSYLARFRLRPDVPVPGNGRTSLCIRITASALQGRVGAICVSDDLRTRMSNSLEWTEAEGEQTLSLVVYAYAGQGWLVLRRTAEPPPSLRFRVSAVEAFTLHDDLRPAEGGDEPKVPRAVVYTAITNAYDRLRAPEPAETGCDYVCFTDDVQAVPPPWKAVKVTGAFRDPRMAAKWYKVHPHLLFPSHAISVWIDGRVALHGPIVTLARAALQGTSLGVLDNPWYQCVYLMAESDVRERRDVREIVERQIERYRRAGLPSHLGGVCLGVVMRRHHDPAVIRAMAAWWDELDGGSHRDQFSLAYVLWRHRLVFRRLWLDSDDNPYFTLDAHRFVDYYRV